jgi:hypothetical protein
MRRRGKREKRGKMEKREDKKGARWGTELSAVGF